MTPEQEECFLRQAHPLYDAYQDEDEELDEPEEE